jgi:voltage-gated potassium channel
MIVAAALLPLAGMFSTDPDAGIGAPLEIACWLVFLADLVVHVRLHPRYLRSPLGRFDLGIVLITFPWFLLFPDADASNLLYLARLARVGRLLLVAFKSATGLRTLARRLGKAAFYAGIAIVVCALVVYRVEPASSGFDSRWDAIWWAIVTITTVGYGDYYPVTVAGRLAGITLMIAGIALLGTLAGTLASFFGGTDADEDAVARDRDPVSEELRLLRAEVVALRAQFPTASSPSTADEADP